MPQVDLESLVSGSSDQKIACEILADEPPTGKYNNYVVSPTGFPPESYFLSKDDQFEWFSDNAFFDRQDSQRGYSGNLNSNHNLNPSSQRFLMKSKTSIFGLPKPQETCFIEAKQRRHGGRVDKNKNILKRVGSLIKTDPLRLEPSSPMVSCIGRVRSRRERSRRMQRQKSARVDPFKDRVKKSGFMASFRAIFRIGRDNKHVSARGTNTLSSRTHDITRRLPQENVEKPPTFEPVVPGLGVMSRFSSGRRTDLLGG